MPLVSARPFSKEMCESFYPRLSVDRPPERSWNTYLQKLSVQNQDSLNHTCLERQSCDGPLQCNIDFSKPTIEFIKVIDFVMLKIYCEYLSGFWRVPCSLNSSVAMTSPTEDPVVQSWDDVTQLLRTRISFTWEKSRDLKISQETLSFWMI